MRKDGTVEEQVKVLCSIRKFIEDHGFAPTERELCLEAGISSRGTVHRHLVRMKYEGLIDYIPGKSRTIRILRK